jgi:hypothetical protein
MPVLKNFFSKMFVETKSKCIFANTKHNNMTQSITIKSVKQMSIEQIKTLINQLEFAMTTEISFESKIKLNQLIGQCVTVYMSKM